MIFDERRGWRAAISTVVFIKFYRNYHNSRRFEIAWNLPPSFQLPTLYEVFQITLFSISLTQANTTVKCFDHILCEKGNSIMEYADNAFPVPRFPLTPLDEQADLGCDRW